MTFTLPRYLIRDVILYFPAPRWAFVAAPWGTGGQYTDKIDCIPSLCPGASVITLTWRYP
jgi:hypothetical protein